MSGVAPTVPGMALWTDFAAAAPRIAEVFTRRHAATGNLCMLGTLRPDGFPRISPMEPRFLEGDLWLVGMPHTAKFADLQADPRFALHTATVDTQVSDGDAKLWGRVEDIRDEALHQRFAEAVYADIGLDLRGQRFDQFLRADIVGAASVAVGDEHMDVTTWREGAEEKVVRKH